MVTRERSTSAARRRDLTIRFTMGFGTKSSTCSERVMAVMNRHIPLSDLF